AARVLKNAPRPPSRQSAVHPAGGRAPAAGLRLRVSLPVRPEGVVALALLGVGKNGVGLADLLEALGVALVHVGMVLAGQPAIGRLDGLVVGRPVDPERLVVVLIFHRRDAYLDGTTAL